LGSAELVTPSLVGQVLRRVYRLQRIQFRSFKYLYRYHSLEYLISIVTPFYDLFVKGFDELILRNDVVLDFLAVQWSCEGITLDQQQALYTWTLSEKKLDSKIIDVLLFRDNRSRNVYEGHREGLLFGGVQDGSISSDNILDIGIWISTSISERQQVNGESGKRSVSLPGLSQSWDSMVQTSSSLFSALSFGTVPARRSPLAIEQKPDVSVAMYEGSWIEGKKIWLEASGERTVPISLGNQRPGFLRESSGQQSPDEDNLVEIEIFIYKVHPSTILTTAQRSPSHIPNDSIFKTSRNI
jgi:hypothetical protein